MVVVVANGSTVKWVSFEWSHTTVSSTDLKI